MGVDGREYDEDAQQEEQGGMGHDIVGQSPAVGTQGDIECVKADGADASAQNEIVTVPIIFVLGKEEGNGGQADDKEARGPDQSRVPTPPGPCAVDQFKDASGEEYGEHRVDGQQVNGPFPNADGKENKGGDEDE